MKRTSRAPNWYYSFTWLTYEHIFNIIFDRAHNIFYYIISLLPISWNHCKRFTSRQFPSSTSFSSYKKLSVLIIQLMFYSFPFFACVCAYLPSACEWKTTTEAVVDGWEGLLINSSSLAATREGASVGSSLSETLAGRAGSSASMGATMQWDSRHSGFTLKRSADTTTVVLRWPSVSLSLHIQPFSVSLCKTKQGGFWHLDRKEEDGQSCGVSEWAVGGCQSNTLVVNKGNSCKRARMQGKTNDVWAAQMKPPLKSHVFFICTSSIQ